jgi:integrase
VFFMLICYIIICNVLELKMNLTHQAKRVEFESGEESYFVVDKEKRCPLEYPALYAMNKLRKKGSAANTIQKVMDSISILYSWAQSSDIQLHERIKAKEFLTEDDLDQLSDFCLLNFKVKDNAKVTKIKVAKVVVPENIKQKTKIKTIRTIEIPSVSSETHYLRITLIAPYLRWLSIQLLGNEAGKERHSIQEMIDELKDCRPRRDRQARFNPKSIEKRDMVTLYEYVDVESESNPFKSKSGKARKIKSIKVRNELIFILCHKLGVRVGELCGIKMKDLHLGGGGGKIDIYRRPTDKGDTRKQRAQVKTEARELPISGKLEKKINDYIVKHRDKVKNATSCEFLFVSHEKSSSPEGSPLSLAAVRKVFSQLSEASGIKVTPHNLRHTWNDDFSEIADEEGMSEVEEMKARRYLMGWSESSKMPDYYAKRRNRKLANNALLKLQNKATKGQSL